MLPCAVRGYVLTCHPGAVTDLFAAAREDGAATPGPGGRPRPGVDRSAPLAERMRPADLDEVVGQDHLLAPGSPLRRLAAPAAGSRGATSVVLWGPPGTGKTTLARALSHGAGQRFVAMSALTSGVREVRAAMETAQRSREVMDERTVLFLDEVHRFSKSQQDALLPGVEAGWVTLVAATTENPSFSIVAPLLSRSLLLTLRPLEEADVLALLRRAVADPRGLGGQVVLDDDAGEHLVRIAGGDARKALTALEAAAGLAAEEDGGDQPRITLALAERAVDVAVVRYDRDGDQHYDVASALIKSVRGSDVDAALHYLARMLEAGEDPRFVARRLMVAAAEDVGMADPSALGVAVAAAQGVALIGMPEARILLGQVVVALATAPKSNAAHAALEAAIADVRAGLGGPVPAHLRDGHYPGATALGHGQGYVYAHDAPHAIAAQRYAPDDLADRVYYEPTDRGHERTLRERLARIAALLGRTRG